MQDKPSVLSGKPPKAKRPAAEWLISAYALLNDSFGNLHWWPGESPFEIIVGAILTQNTAWQNVEKAIQSLKDKEMLFLRVMLEADHDILAEAIRPSGYYNVKAKRLKAFLRFIQDNYAGDLSLMFAEELQRLRDQFLGVTGIGEETADSILLYAGQKPIFVVDAYTRRILSRHGLIAGSESYSVIQNLFMKTFPDDIGLYNQYHALMVETGKTYCQKRPRCSACPICNMT